MKYLANFLRICVGLLFIFSGLIKSNDPTGFSYKLDEYFSVFSADLEPSQDSLIICFNHHNQIDTFSYTINPNQQKIDIVVDQSPWINNTSDESIFERELTFNLNNQEIYRSNTTSFDTLSYISKLSYEISNKLIGQKNIKRLLAYSSIGHIGYALAGVATGVVSGYESAIIYIAIYVIMNIGAFSCLYLLKKDGEYKENISDLSGISKKHPILAISFLLILFSLAGIPPLGGFFAKFYVFTAVLEQQMYTLAIIGLLTTVISAFYYLKIIKLIFSYLLGRKEI